MKKGYSVDKPNFFIGYKFMYICNYDMLNIIVGLCSIKDFKERYSNKKECVGVWKIKNKN